MQRTTVMSNSHPRCRVQYFAALPISDVIYSGKLAIGASILKSIAGQRFSGEHPGKPALIDNQPPIDEQILDTGSKLVWLVKRRDIGEGFCVEYDDISEAAFCQFSPFFKSDHFCRQ